jgi:hypothetical protein
MASTMNGMTKARMKETLSNLTNPALLTKQKPDCQGGLGIDHSTKPERISSLYSETLRIFY